MRSVRRYPLSVETAAPGKLVRTRTRPATGAGSSSGSAAASVTYLGRTLLPLASTFRQQSTYTVQAGDRIDNVSAKLLGDPLLYWMLMEANGASDPGLLCAVPGRRIVVPASVGQGASPFDQPAATRRGAAPALATSADDGDETP